TAQKIQVMKIPWLQFTSQPIILRRGGIMPTYLCLLSWTKEGVEKVKDSPSRLDAGKKAFEAAGCKINTALLLMGRYDMAIVAEAPDDATIARMTLALASQGSVRTETPR